MDNCFVLEKDGWLSQLIGSPPTIVTPQDDIGLAPGPGDDTTPPNATKINGLAALALANIGFSSASGQERVYPSAYSYEMRVMREGDGDGAYGLEARLVLEYDNPQPGEGMVVSMKKIKQLMCEPSSLDAQVDAGASQLVLVDTTFMDLVSGEWQTINTDVRYTATAEAVAEAVMTSDEGQTVGMLKQTGAVETAKLGPVGDKGRVVLTYRCEELATVKEIILPGQPGAECGRDLVPIAVHLPHASTLARNDADARLDVSLRCPRGTRLLDPATNAPALDHIRTNQLPGGTTVVVPDVSCLLVEEAKAGAKAGAKEVTFAHEWAAVPPRPTSLLLWLSVPPAPAAGGREEDTGAMAAELGGFTPISAADAAGMTEGKATEEGKTTKAATDHDHGVPGKVSTTTIHVPVADEDRRNMCVPLPGGQTGYLLKATMQTNSASLPEGMVRLHTAATITDASGSTGCGARGGGWGAGRRGEETVRDRFNYMARRRFLTRLGSVPKLVAAGVLRPDDLLCDALYVFDHRVKLDRRAVFLVGDLDAETVAALGRAVGADTEAVGRAEATAALARSGKQALLTAVQEHLAAIAGIRSGGATAFAPPCSQLASDYERKIVGEALRRAGKPGQRAKLLETTFVNFDTDGGHNTGTCYAAVRDMVAKCAVVGGIVNGCGAWVDQECATRVARILGGPCLLSVEFPDDAAADQIFRQDLSCWIKALRSLPMKLTCGAGAVSWAARHGPRDENAVDVLAIKTAPSVAGSGRKTKPAFGPPDIRALDHTRSTLEGMSVGDGFVAYLLSRVPPEELARRFDLEINGASGGGRVRLGDDVRRGVFVAHEWLSLLQPAARGAGGRVVVDKAALVPRLADRIEDELSFRYNLPAPSGATAALGRAKTAHRPVVPKDHLPPEPNVALDLDELADLLKKNKGALGPDQDSLLGSMQAAMDDDDLEEELEELVESKRMAPLPRGPPSYASRPPPVAYSAAASHYSAPPPPPGAMRKCAPPPAPAGPPPPPGPPAPAMLGLGGAMRCAGGAPARGPPPARSRGPAMMGMMKQKKRSSSGVRGRGRGGGRGGGRGDGRGGTGGGGGKGFGGSRGFFGRAERKEDTAAEQEHPTHPKLMVASPGQVLLFSDSLRISKLVREGRASLPRADTVRALVDLLLSNGSGGDCGSVSMLVAPPAPIDPLVDGILGDMYGGGDSGGSGGAAAVDGALGEAQRRARWVLRIVAMLRAWWPLVLGSTRGEALLIAGVAFREQTAAMARAIEEGEPLPAAKMPDPAAIGRMLRDALKREAMDSAVTFQPTYAHGIDGADGAPAPGDRPCGAGRGPILSFGRPKRQVVHCNKGHRMESTDFRGGLYRAAGWECDRCKRTDYTGGKRWCCRTCVEDYCFNCIAEY